MLDRMVEHARREAPNECVGVLGARDGEAQLLVEAENARRSPLAYEIAPQELLRVHDRLDEDDLEVGAIYHSHTRTEPVPSQTDINLAKWWPDPLYVIVGLEQPEPDVRAWRIVDGTVSEAALEVDDGPAPFT
jgi:[CysO sulfur-carrier protein]-S-L-cysteine hydrolase